MKKILLIFAYWLPLLSSAQQHYWQQEVNNKIDVSLNDIEHTLDGFIKIQYTNNSPDTLHFIWFHVWPNAFKTDRTAFSEQLLQNGRTDFYFSDKEQKGYINRLDFRVNGTEAKTEDHPLYIDIIKVLLPNPLLPNQQIEITTPFHVKLPYNFSRGGHVGQSYQITQWYPKPAVYDSKGWHEIPYLDQGEFYSEFGDFDVRITIPKNYVVAATGELQNDNEKKWLLTKNQDTRIKSQEVRAKDSKWGVKSNHKPQTTNYKQILSDKETKTLQYKQNKVHDFAWFADKNFIVGHDTLQLASGKMIDVYSFYLSKENSPWKRSVDFIKSAIRFRSSSIGEYPFSTVSAVEAKMGFNGGMEYPTITSISPMSSEKELDITIEHEVGHNWFYAILANNEREHPWMDEGINTFYNNNYALKKYGTPLQLDVEQRWLRKRTPDDIVNTALQTMSEIKKDQPIETPSESFSKFNYGLIAYEKTAEWMKLLEKFLGQDVFNNCMKEYYRRWQFKHPYPEDFRKTVEEVSEKNVDEIFALLNKKGMLEKENIKRKTKFTFLFSEKKEDVYNYISLAPAVGFNMYDKFMVGAVIHNFNLPPNKFQFILVPLYATNSRQFNGMGELSYAWYPDNNFQKIKIGLNGARFSTNQSLDTNGNKVFENFYKIVPSLRFYFRHEPLSTISRWIDFRTFLIGEKTFNQFGLISGGDSSVSFPISFSNNFRYINQITLGADNFRALYPYDYQIQLQQGDGFYRLNLTGNYFFNYSKGGGFKLRLFAAKFGYIGGKTFSVYQYEPKLLAANGTDDYTYSNYFLGRSAASNNPEKPIANDGLAAQQIMIKDGGLKFRMDLFPYLQGSSDNWVAAINLNTSLPASIIPKQIPLKVFFDIGTYADAWGNNPQTSKFLYAGGLQLSLLKNIVNIYAPLFYSSDFRSTLKSFPQQNTFWKKIFFSIDIQNINLRRINRNIPF